jgi:hypothetical protein
MKVDMSSEAVGARLRTMDELWILSVKLMNSKPIDALGSPPASKRGIRIQDSIRQVLYNDWDPLGINDYPSTVDEYDDYIAPIYRILVGSRSCDEVAETLRRLAIEKMGVSAGGTEKLDSVAKKLLRLDVMI